MTTPSNNPVELVETVARALHRFRRMRNLIDAAWEFEPPNIHDLYRDMARAAIEACGIQSLTDEIRELRERLADLRRWAAVLHQNSVGCAQEHYGHDFAEQGMPGWLTDAKTAIEKAAALTSQSGRVG